MIKVLRHNIGTLRAIVEPTESEYQDMQLRGVDVVTATHSSALPVFFERGDYADVYGERYFLTIIKSEMVYMRNFSYSLSFEGMVSRLGRVQFLFLDNLNELTVASFSLNATAQGFVELLVNNLKRVFPNDGWKIGGVLESETKNLPFEGNNCLEVLNTLADTFETEYTIEGTTINLFKKQPASGLILKAGPDQALFGVTVEPQDNSNPVTRLYAYGSSKNLGSNYRLGRTRLRMPDSLYIEKYADELGVYEHTMNFEDIFPHRTGIVSSVDSPFIFGDSSMDFDLNDDDVLMPGVTAKVTFNTGLLSGYTFEVSSYDNATKKFTINKNTEEQTIDVPSVSMTPAIGDEYVITDVIMDETYIIKSESDLKIAATKWMLDNYPNGLPKDKVTVVCNTFWFKKNVTALKLGQTVFLDVPELKLNMQIRITAIKRNLRNKNLYAIELSDVAKTNTLVKLISNI